MHAKINTITFNGLEILDVDLQIHISSGLPAFTIVGLPDKAVAESRERVRAALSSMGLSIPAKRITINLAPADLLKEGAHFDLPVAMAILVGMEIISQEDLDSYVVVGELSLDGGINKVNGVLPIALHASKNNKGLICPKDNGCEAAWSGSKNIIAANSLLSLINHFKGVQTIAPPEAKKLEEQSCLLDMSDVKGQETAKRALEIAAAGAHNMLMVGPPGSGKSMLASRLITILPPMCAEEALETSTIHSVAGELKDGKLKFTRPYRDPHHNASTPSLIGGGAKAKPGEISLAHNGVLFLDELPEFNKATLEALRQPLENKYVTVSRVNTHAKYPANFQFVAAMNPCRCGNLGNHNLECTRAPKCAAEYQAKISGPLLDRIDIHIEVPAVSPWDMAHMKAGESSAEILKRVVKAREIQKKRFEKHNIFNLRTNSELKGDLLEEAVALDDKAKDFLVNSANKLNLSARSFHRVLRIARTIADLQNEEKVINIHLAEALSYRRTANSL